MMTDAEPRDHAAVSAAADASRPFDDSAVPIRVERRGAVGVVTLTRTRAVNAFDLAMLHALRETLAAWRHDRTIEVVVLRGEGRGFCAGGDVKAIARRRGDHAFMDEVYRTEYDLDHLLHTLDRPVVALLHGITMGGGCGISLHASHPVAAEDLALAMPETAIGLFPDVASSRFLARCPAGIGLHLALTGETIGLADALEFGLVRAFVPRARHDALIDVIAVGRDVDDAITAFAAAPETAESHTAPARIAHRDEIAEAFHGTSALTIVQRLEARTSAFARKTAAKLRTLCPFSLEVTARLMAGGGERSVREALALDFRVAQRMMQRSDFFEGVRAGLIDKSGDPRWSPVRLEDVEIAEVEACFAPLPGRELWDAGVTET